MPVASSALSSERAARGYQHRRAKFERAAQKPSGATVRFVDDKLIGWKRIRKRYVTKQIALA